MPSGYTYKARVGAMVVTLQDVAPLAMPDPRWSRWFKNARAKWRYREVARLATHVIAISEFSAREAHRHLGIPYDRMTVVLDGGDFGAPPDAAGDAAALESQVVAAIRAGDVVMVKGSLGSRMKTIVT